MYSNRLSRWSALIERLDLGAEGLVLAGRHLPQGRHGQVQQGQAERVRQGLDRGGQPQGFGEVRRLSAGLQPGQLEVPQLRPRVQEQGVDQGASAERLLGGDAERVGDAGVQRLGVADFFRVDVADPGRRLRRRTPRTGSGTCGSPGNRRQPGERRDAAGAGAFEFFPVDADRLHLRVLAVELGIEPADAVVEGRVGGQQSGEPRAGEGVGEKHVADLGGLGVVDARPLVPARRSS